MSDEMNNHRHVPPAPPAPPPPTPLQAAYDVAIAYAKAQAEPPRIHFPDDSARQKTARFWTAHLSVLTRCREYAGSVPPSLGVEPHHLLEGWRTLAVQGDVSLIALAPLVQALETAGIPVPPHHTPIPCLGLWAHLARACSAEIAGLPRLAVNPQTRQIGIVSEGGVIVPLAHGQAEKIRDRHQALSIIRERLVEEGQLITLSVVQQFQEVWTEAGGTDAPAGG